MKRFIQYITGLFAFAVLSVSCSEWFDVSPKTDLKADDLFSTESGFLSALAGVYISLTNDYSYGYALSYGTIDMLAQLYDMVPDQAVNKESIYTYTVETNGYNTKAMLAALWQQEYNIIADINNLLKWLDKNGETVISDAETRDMIRGEAMGLRAYLHFSLLEAWGPIYNDEPDALSIPYRVVTDNSKMPRLAASELVENILNDLLAARELLSYEKDVDLGNSLNLQRRFRFNYHAVSAALAEVYCYKGDNADALLYANEAIDNCGLELQTENLYDPSLFEETIFGINLYKMSDRVGDYFADGEKFTTHLYVNFQTLNSIFDEGLDDDMRAGDGAFIRKDNLEQAISRKYIKNEEQVIPIIRLPMMYYILCEMTSDLSAAAPFINTVRNKRGYSSTTNYNFNDEEDRTLSLLKEYTKEFYAEGKTFFFMKRHKIEGTSHTDITFDEEKYVFPLPDREIEYGWTPENEGADASGGSDDTAGEGGDDSAEEGK